jgi:hypothetical protein
MANWKRVAFWVLLFAFWYTAPTEGDAPITLTVTPKVAIQNPYKDTTFRMLIRIPEHKDNRRMAYAADCGGNVITTQREYFAVHTEVFPNMRVVADCIFQACVYRLEGKENEKPKVRRYCDTHIIETGGRDGKASDGHSVKLPPL